VIIAGVGEISKGQTFWLEPDKSKQFGFSRASGLSQIELLRLDFRTKPKKR